ncbi:MAG: TerB family tellurite resistance protein [Bacteroidota bacterium]
MSQAYENGLLHIIHLLISADGIVHDWERKAFDQIRLHEHISEETFAKFSAAVEGKKERDIYNEGIRLLNSCDDEAKLRAFVHLYRLAEADNNIHVKEVRLLLYSIKLAGVEFNDIVALAKEVPS